MFINIIHSKNLKFVSLLLFGKWSWAERAIINSVIETMD